MCDIIQNRNTVGQTHIIANRQSDIVKSKLPIKFKHMQSTMNVEITDYVMCCWSDCNGCSTNDFVAFKPVILLNDLLIRAVS